MDMRLTPFVSALFLTLALWGCTEPIEPGSDLEDPAPPAEVGDFEQFEVDDTFVLRGKFDTMMDGIQPLPLGAATLLIWQKSGDIEREGAEMSTVVLYLSDPMFPTPPMPARARVSAAGKFKVTINDLLLFGPPPPGMDDMGASAMDMSAPLTEDMGMAVPSPVGTLVLDARIRSTVCVDGTATFTINGSPFALTTMFAATKQGIDVPVQEDGNNVACDTSAGANP